MEKYILPRSLEVDPRVHARLKGELRLIFLAGILCGKTYLAIGLDSLWSLIGLVASMQEPFAFEIRPNAIQAGIAGGESVLQESGEDGIFELVGREVFWMTSASGCHVAWASGP